MEVGFEERRIMMKGFTTPGEGLVDNFSLSACDLQFLHLLLKNNRARSNPAYNPANNRLPAGGSGGSSLSGASSESSRRRVTPRDRR